MADGGRRFGFDPDAIAVVGASTDPAKLTGRPVRYLLDHGYPGEIYPINPNAETIAGLDCYPDIKALPEPPDLAMIMLPADIVPETVETCLAAGVEEVVVVSSGFAETGDPDAVAAEERLLALADDHDACLVGPNSQGVINVPARMTASFTPALARDELLSGGVSFVTQSGAFGGALTTLLQERGIGLNRWVSTGNEADLTALDFANQLAHDPDTDVVAGYIEGFDDGCELVALRRTAAGIDTPVVLLKVGRSRAGKAAAQSHTGTVAGDDAVYRSVFTETGVMDVGNVEEFVDVVEMVTRLAGEPGRRLGVLSTSGGAGVHIADVAGEAGLELPELTGDTRARIEDHIPAYGTARNPVDVTAQVASAPAAFIDCLTLLLDDQSLDAVVLQITNLGGDRATARADRIVEAIDGRETPLAVAWTGGTEKGDGVATLRAAGVPVFEDPARCVRALGRVADYATARPRMQAASDLPARLAGPAAEDHPAVLTEPAAKRLLADYGIDVPAGRLVERPDAAGAVAADLGYPVVAKLVAPSLRHRSRIDGVRTGLATPEAVERACEELLAIAEHRDIAVDGVTIQAQVPGGIEVALGITDSDFGPVVMLARGGTAIEAVDDTAFRTIPVAREQAASMLPELDTLSGDRLGRKATSDLLDALEALSAVYVDNQWIREADINPVVVTSERVVAVDALFLG